MSFNILDAAKGLISNELISKAAGTLGESESGITKALSGAIPSVLAGLISNNANHGSSGIMDLVKGAAGSGLLGNLGNLFGSESHSTGMASTVLGWLKTIFGSRLNNIINSISGFAGINNSSASSILSLAAPAVLGAVGKHVADNNISEGGLSSLLNSAKSSVLSAVPAGLNLSNALGIEDLNNLDTKVSAVAHEATGHVKHAADQVEEAAGGGMKWLWPLVLLLALAGIIYFLTQKGCNNKEGDTTGGTTATTETTNTANATDTSAAAANTTASVGTVDTVTGDFIYNVGKMIKIDLPNNGGSLEVGENSTEAKLVKFLQSSDPVDTAKGNWFDFTNVHFKTGSSDITEESMTQLKNMVSISKAFPTAAFKVGGYTDNTGNDAKNVELSKKRAAIVAKQLVTLGSAAQSIVSSDGYGSKFPIGDNNTAEGRAQNRRVSVNVKAK